ncbi:MAG: ABC transporter permease [Planctomycetia bacterium]|nr:ABC transporter permease [Planctomycetia bacterium]
MMSRRADTAAPRGGSLMRLRGLVRKEFLQVVRDKSSIGIAFLLPTVLLLLFGYGVSLDAKHVPIAIVVQQPSADTARLVGVFQGSEYFDPSVMLSTREAVAAMEQGRVKAIVHVRANFADRLRADPGAPIQVIVNGVDANTARLIQGYVQGAWQSWLAATARADGLILPPAVDVQHRIWFNPGVRSRDFLVPGLIPLVMVLIGALLTALVMAREWERGTMESLLVTPVTIREILVGKLAAYFSLGLGGMLLSVFMATWLFGVPLRGSFWVLLLASSLFLVVALGMGLLISTVARNQFVASQVAILSTYLPTFILSGFIFDIGSMPKPIQVITYAIPARYFVSILQTVFLAGDVWPVILPNMLALLAMAVVLLGLTRLRLKKRLQ